MLPERKLKKAEEFFETFPEIREVFIDGTERQTQRLRDSRTQNNKKINTLVKRNDTLQRILSYQIRRNKYCF